MKISQDYQSNDWSGSHLRFTQGGAEIVGLGLVQTDQPREIPEVEISLVRPGDRESREETIMERLGMNVPSPPPVPHPSWIPIWDPEAGAYYLWHEDSRVSRWALVATPTRILSHETIRVCEELASGECPEKRASVFRKAIYGSSDYKNNLGNMRRGNGAENWKDEEGVTFLCVSLEEVNKVYVKLGRRDWYENGSKGKRKECPSEIRCVEITAKGDRCSKKMCEGQGAAIGPGRCTQHWKKFLRS